MRILFDGPYTKNPKGGVLRYFYELSENIAKSYEVAFSRKLGNLSSNSIKLPVLSHFRPHRLSFYFEYLWFCYCYKNKFQVVHPIEFQLSPTGDFFVKDGAKLVITIHDLIHEKFGSPENLYSKMSRTAYYKRADGLIFVSQSTKNDFEEFYPDIFKNKPSKVILHGSNFKNIDIPIKNSKKFLFVGSRRGYKNFSTAAKAFREIAKNDPTTRLVVAGAPPYQDELELLKDVSNQINWVCFPNTKQLKGLYAESLALLYVSKYEGFGMPLLEAMSQGCIPIAGNHSSIPEVLDTAGILINDLTPENIANQMRQLLASSKETDEMISIGQI